MRVCAARVCVERWGEDGFWTGIIETKEDQRKDRHTKRNVSFK